MRLQLLLLLLLQLGPLAFEKDPEFVFQDWSQLMQSIGGKVHGPHSRFHVEEHVPHRVGWIGQISRVKGQIGRDGMTFRETFVGHTQNGWINVDTNRLSGPTRWIIEGMEIDPSIATSEVNMDVVHIQLRQIERFACNGIRCRYPRRQRRLFQILLYGVSTVIEGFRTEQSSVVTLYSCCCCCCSSSLSRQGGFGFGPNRCLPLIQCAGPVHGMRPLQLTKAAHPSRSGRWPTS